MMNAPSVSRASSDPLELQPQPEPVFGDPTLPASAAGPPSRPKPPLPGPPSGVIANVHAPLTQVRPPGQVTFTQAESMHTPVLATQTCAAGQVTPVQRDTQPPELALHTCVAGQLTLSQTPPQRPSRQV